jgi:hypothetical protein
MGRRRSAQGRFQTGAKHTHFFLLLDGRFAAAGRPLDQAFFSSVSRPAKASLDSHQRESARPSSELMPAIIPTAAVHGTSSSLPQV